MCFVTAILQIIGLVIILLLCQWGLKKVLNTDVPERIVQLIGFFLAIVLIVQWLQCAGLIGGSLGWHLRL